MMMILLNKRVVHRTDTARENMVMGSIVHNAVKWWFRERYSGIDESLGKLRQLTGQRSKNKWGG